MSQGRPQISQEMPSIAGNEDVVDVENEWHQIMILPTTFSDPAYVIARDASLLG